MLQYIPTYRPCFKISFGKNEEKQRDDDISKQKHYDARKPEVIYSCQHPLEKAGRQKNRGEKRNQRGIAHYWQKIAFCS